MTGPETRYLRVVSPIVDETGRPIATPAEWAGPAQVHVRGLQHGGAADGAGRLTDAASPRLRESAANLLVIIRALCLFGLAAGATVTVLIVLARLWGWLL
jgi:hypothetical protein